MKITLKGHQAIAYVEALGLDCGLRKYADPIEGERRHLSLDEAREIARIDPSLIWFEADTEHPDHTSTMDAIGVASAAATLGRLGGAAKSPAKQEAARENGKRGGRPKKVPAPIIRYTPEVQLFTANGDFITDERAREVWDGGTGDWSQGAFQEMSRRVMSE